MSLRGLGRGYLPILLSFATPQLILQTDLVMVSALGEAAATAAYAVPVRVALLDAVLMMALASVTSATVVAARREGKAAKACYGALAVAALLGIAVAALGVVLYPRAAYWVAEEERVAELASGALLLFALATPLRLLAAVAVMALHALGHGPVVVRWKLAEVGLNAFLNALLIYSLALGFIGAYVATIGVMVFSCVWSVSRLISHLGEPLHPPGWGWVRGFLGQSAWESKRLLSAQLFALAGMVLFATAAISPSDLARLSAYSAGSALALFLFTPLLALFRLLGFRFAELSPDESAAALVRLVRFGLPLSLVAAAMLCLGGEGLGRTVYGISGKWWAPVPALIALALPLRFLNTLLRGALQSNRRFAQVALVDVAVIWGVGLPLIAAGLYLQAPALAFAFLVLPELCAMPLLWRELRPIILVTKPRQTP